MHVLYPPDPAAIRRISEADLNLADASNVPSESLTRTSSPVQQKQQANMKLCSGMCCYGTTGEEIVELFSIYKKKIPSLRLDKKLDIFPS